MDDWNELRRMTGNELSAKPGWKTWEPRRRRRKALRVALAPLLVKGKEALWDALPPALRLGAVVLHTAVAVWGHWRSKA